MAALLTFDILGMYPVPASTQVLIGSPLVSAFTINNRLLGTSTKFTVSNFVSTEARAVKQVTVDGQIQNSRCAISWNDVVGGKSIVIELYADGEVSEFGCAAHGSNADGGDEAARPDSLGSGGFAIP